MHPLVALAEKAIAEYLEKGTVANPPDEQDETMKQKAGVFVSLKKHGQLRGCIGTFLPVTGCVAEEVIRNALAAATEDPRFAPVDMAELGDIACSVDVLSPPEKVSGPQELDPKRYGVIVTKGFRKGLLLPDLEGVDTVEEQLRIACLKAQISPGDKDIEIHRFEVRRYR